MAKIELMEFYHLILKFQNWHIFWVANKGVGCNLVAQWKSTIDRIRKSGSMLLRWQEIIIFYQVALTTSWCICINVPHFCIAIAIATTGIRSIWVISLFLYCWFFKSMTSPVSLVIVVEKKVMLQGFNVGNLSNHKHWYHLEYRHAMWCDSFSVTCISFIWSLVLPICNIVYVPTYMMIHLIST